MAMTVLETGLKIPWYLDFCLYRTSEIPIKIRTKFLHFTSGENEKIPSGI
jgi:hypothetical protein